ncbi:hypothetical protein EVAR_23375_1 [Eumeta japonica]|uniref:Uncharacterized protein n=1 Tax=Eumeta variegata TaxID=151549 RepID=A0A4C1VY30_EUMVA|nr:hypothetical protein EVAR_23375_1 [Eumeta japonica]
MVKVEVVNFLNSPLLQQENVMNIRGASHREEYTRRLTDPENAGAEPPALTGQSGGAGSCNPPDYHQSRRHAGLCKRK